MRRLIPARSRWLLVLALLGLLGCGGGDASPKAGHVEEPNVRVNGGRAVTESLGKGSVEMARQRAIRDSFLEKSK